MSTPRSRHPRPDHRGHDHAHATRILAGEGFDTPDLLAAKALLG